MSIHLLEQLKQNPFVLAPMAGVTDSAFRSLMKEFGANIVFTELISAHGIQHQNKATQELLKFSKTQSPIGVQIFGEDPKVMGRAASIVEEMGYEFVDINLGCPVKKIVKKGAGAAILKDTKLLSCILKQVKSSLTKIPLTIKIRTGWDETSRNANEVCHIAYNEGVTWVTIHGRTRSQAYSGEADWNYIQQIKSQSPIPIIGNGDIITATQAVNRLTQSQCDGVMIGRGCLKRPWIIQEALHIYQRKNMFFKTDPLNAINILHKYLTQNVEPHKVLIQMKKFTAWFSTGYINSTAFRKEIFQTKNIEQMMEHARLYFESAKNFDREEDKNFMMAGHG